MEEKIDILTISQLGKLLQVGTNKSQEIMRAIKALAWACYEIEKIRDNANETKSEAI